MCSRILLTGLVGVLASGGCDRPRGGNRYVALEGQIVACYPETGELSIRASQGPFAGDPGSETLQCVVTKDTEIYIDDRFASIEEVELGQTVELIGYQDLNPRLRRFVVSFVHCSRTKTPPQLPEPTGRRSEEG